MNDKMFVVLTSILLLLSTLSIQSTYPSHFGLVMSEQPIKSEPYSPSYENVTVHEGDLIIDGTQTFIVENCTWIQKGNIYVEDYGKLIIRNVKLVVNQTYFWEYEVVIKDHGSLKIDNAIIESNREGLALNFRFEGFSKVEVDSLSYKVVWRAPNLGIGQHSDVSIINSTVASIETSDTPTIRIVNSTITSWFGLWFPKGYSIEVSKLNPGKFQFLDLRDRITFKKDGLSIPLDVTLNDTYVGKWHICARYDSKTLISESELELRIIVDGLSVQLANLKPQFFESESIGYITLNKTLISGEFCVQAFDLSEVAIVNSSVSLGANQNSNVKLINSILTGFLAAEFHGIIYSRNSSWLGGIIIFQSDFSICGNITIQKPEITWVSSNVTREYNVIVKYSDGKTASNATITLKSKDGTEVWNGTTDAQGRTNFNVSFSDSNYKDFWRLTASIDRWNASQQIGFLTDTPVKIMLDNMSPNVEVIRPVNGSVIYGTIQIKALVSDNVQLERLFLYVDEVLVENVSLPWKSYTYTTSMNTRTLVNGTHTLTVTAQDVSGNVNTTTIVINVQNILGDLDGSGTVNIIDVAIVARAFGSRAGEPKWNPEADLDSNGEINIVDISMVARQFGKTVYG